jgi:DNA repair exonuclease SbcCD ATPase subunit
MDTLAKAGLEDVIIGDDDIPTRLGKIESAVKPDLPQLPILETRYPVPSFIRRIQLIDYRPFPAIKEFEFGAVNLIVGSNATGKTSLLEAIELYYCGRNKRSGTRPESYELRLEFADGGKETATNARQLAEFRDKNLLWYGQPEIKTHNIDQSFSRFNFLNTDAAVNISESMADLEEALSKLLIGPDASKIWHSMVRVKDALVSKVRELRREIAQRDEELAELAKITAVEASGQQNSEVLLQRLSEILHAQGWVFDSAAGVNDAVDRLYSTLSEYAVTTGQASSLGWIAAPITRQAMDSYCSEAGQKIETLEIACTSLAKMDDALRSNQLTLDQTRQILSLLLKARDFIESGLIAARAQHAILETDLAKNTGILLSLNVEPLDLELVKQANAGDASVESIRDQAAEWLKQADAASEAARSAYRDFSSIRDRAFNLVQQLRQIAGAILDGQEDKDTCPLCRTPFGKGELAKHMVDGAHSDLDLTAQTLLSRVNDAERTAQRSRRFFDLISQLAEFLLRSSNPMEATVRQALLLVENIRQAIDGSRARIGQLQREIEAVEGQGFKFDDFQEIATHLTRLGVQAATDSEGIRSQVDQYERRITSDSAAMTVSLEQRSTWIARTAAELTGSQSADLRAFLGTYRDRVAITSKLAAELEDFFQTYPWHPDGTITELIVAINSVRSFASEIRTALKEEAQRRELDRTTLERRSVLEERRTKLETQLKPYSNAFTVLELLTENHKLSDAMEEALVQNKEGIESIFLRIHSPDEFAGLGESFPTLLRKSGEQAPLTQISTGQRAAFALSIFLAQNAQLVGAPPVMLIDDPIAHIDDLNSLSFLDYLRDLTMRGGRQVFFATANDKLASLFERKFDFLGEDFRRITLRRSIADGNIRN